MAASKIDEHRDDGRNRRQHARIPAETLPHVTARVVGGPQVRLLDVSKRGARVETGLPLRPGRPVTLRFVAADTTLTLTGAVVRSSVAVLAEEGVKYHTALSFAEDLLVCPDGPGGNGPNDSQDLAALPGAHRDRSDAVSDDRPQLSDDVMVVPAPHDTASALRERLFANSW